MPFVVPGALTRVLDLLLPPRCLGCGADVAGASGLCGECWNAVSFLAPPWCACCGLPFPHQPGLLANPESLCAACIGAPPLYERARSALAYDAGSRRLILGFKHGDRLDVAPLLARWLTRASGELLASADFVAPVPLHWTRLFRRRFNQSAVLAKLIVTGSATPGDKAKPRFAPDLLWRRRRTGSQEGRSRAGRFRNVASAFALNGRYPLAGRRVLLIDDVLTTGATAEECARVLLRGGAAAVDVATLARVIRTT